MAALERVQCRATKMILRSRNSNYEQRLRKLDLLLLEQRCLLLDVVFLHKVINGHLNIDVTPYLQFYTEHERYTLHCKDTCTLTIKKTGCRTNIFRYSYFNHVVDSWNCLPKHIRVLC